MSDTVSEPSLLLSGLDSLYVSFYLDTTSGMLDWDDLGYRKEHLRTTRGKLEEVPLGSERLALLPRGAAPYPFVLTNRDFEIRLAERMQPCCHVQLSSEALWTHGIDALEARLRRWFASMGFRTFRPEVVGRADWAFDYGLRVIDFDENSFVTRATKDAKNREHRIAQTFRFGAGDIVLRVYDKVTEIQQQSGKSWFFDLWGQSADVWRIEWQVRGNRLKTAGIVTLDDLRTCQGDLLRELSVRHTRLCQPREGDINRARWPLHPLWRRLQRDIETLEQTGLVRSFPPESPLEWRLERQARSLYGSLKGVAAVVALIEARETPPSFAELLRHLPVLLKHEHAEPIWETDVAKRMTAHGYGKW